MPNELQRPRVVVLDPDLASAAREIAPRYEGIELVTLAEDGTRPPGAGVHAIITQDAAVDAALLDTLGDLRIVLKLGRNYQNIDAAAVRARGLTLACVPRKGPNCVAELAMTFILALSKDLLISHRSVAEGAYRLRGLRPERTAQWKMAFHWMRHQRLHEIYGKSLGIIGFGEIGCELARRAGAMGMQVSYYKRQRLPAELEERFEARYQDLPDLLQQSDYVCLAVPHTDSTERMIGAEQLALMKPDAYLVNICRGGVVDETALVEALREQRIAGAGLDVFTYEPLPADSPLCTLDNVILTPHVGGGTGTTRQLELVTGLEELTRLLEAPHPLRRGQKGAKV
jgi:phosphoglycerate dehydrogenase-like enzyme